MAVKERKDLLPGWPVLDEDDVCHVARVLDLEGAPLGTWCGAPLDGCEKNPVLGEYAGQEVCPDCGRIVCPECARLAKEDAAASG